MPPTTSRNFRIPDEVYDPARDAAKANNDKLPQVVIRALLAYAADPLEFNLACATIVREASR